jgi:hypothetical protein
LRRAAGECAAFMAEQFVLEHGLRHGGAVDGDERSAGAAGTFMQKACGEFLADAAFAVEQDRGFGFRCARQMVDAAQKRRRVADHAHVLAAQRKFGFQRVHHFAQIKLTIGAPDRIALDARARGVAVAVVMRMQHFAGLAAAEQGQMRAQLAVFVTRARRVMRNLVAAPRQHFFAAHAVLPAIALVGRDDAVFGVNRDKRTLVGFDQLVQVGKQHG